MEGINLSLEEALNFLRHDIANAVIRINKDNEKEFLVSSEPCLDELEAAMVVVDAYGFRPASTVLHHVAGKNYIPPTVLESVGRPGSGFHSKEVISRYGMSEYDALNLLYEYHHRKDLIMDVTFGPGKGGRCWCMDINESHMLTVLAVLCYREAKYFPDWEYHRDLVKECQGD